MNIFQAKERDKPRRFGMRCKYCGGEASDYEYTNGDVTGCTVIDEVTYHAIQESGPWDC